MLTPKVKEALDEVEGALRNALYLAAKNERPQINFQIAELLSAVNRINKLETMNDKIDDMIKNKNGDNGTFFGGMF
jgi:hypothetical protein